MHSNADADDFFSTSSTRIVKLEKQTLGYCGFHLARSKWDPYPWITKIDPDSPAECAGMHPGECILEINGEDIVGKRISEVADRIKSGPNQVSLLIWNSGTHPKCTSESLCCGPLPQNLQKLRSCLSSILAALECPVCLETVSPPACVCDNGHLMCLRCRAKSEKCPVCRMRLYRGRSLFAEHVYETVTDVFELREDTEQERKTKIQKLFKLPCKNKNILDVKVIPSYKNKFLARLTGKSSSLNNLSNEDHKYNPNLLKVPLEQNFAATLKIKSLSSNEIFKSSTPAISRTSSSLQVNACVNKSNTANCNLVKRTLNSASYHGSLEALERNFPLENSNNLFQHSTDLMKNTQIIYQCPYTPDCSESIKGSEILQHFQACHKGPLVQYFQQKFKLPFGNIVIQENPCYVIHFHGMMFLLRILGISKDEYKISTNFSQVLMWMWLVGDYKTSSQFQLQIKIYNLEGTEVLGVTSPIYSLKNAPWNSMLEHKRGVFLNTVNTQESLEIEIISVADQSFNI